MTFEGYIDRPPSLLSPRERCGGSSAVPRAVRNPVREVGLRLVREYSGEVRTGGLQDLCHVPVSKDRFSSGTDGGPVDAA